MAEADIIKRLDRIESRLKKKTKPSVAFLSALVQVLGQIASVVTGLLVFSVIIEKKYGTGSIIYIILVTVIILLAIFFTELLKEMKEEEED